MADFLPNLWESVFVSGPTPTLLLATNATFALLQVTLALLLAATYSIHFAVLSVICGGLWWSINWFASEVAAVRAEEEAKAKREKEEADLKAGEGESADDEGESTEVDEGTGVGLEASRGSLSLSGFEEGIVSSGREEEGASAAAASARQRNVKTPDLSGTDSEWEKVEGGR